MWVFLIMKVTLKDCKKRQLKLLDKAWMAQALKF